MGLRNQIAKSPEIDPALTLNLFQGIQGSSGQGSGHLITSFIGLKLKNPVFLASGVAGFGEEYSKVIDLNVVGGFITKTITLNPRQGNPAPRIVETSSGIINSIGLENPGLEEFIKTKLPVIRKLFKIPVVVSIAGERSSEFVTIVKKLNKKSGIAAFELNLSCPNIKVRQTFKPALICQNTQMTYRIVKAVKKITKLPIIAKLSPVVTDIAEIAHCCKSAGADAVSLINSFPAISFTQSQIINSQSFIFGGLSGPCIKPIALRVVYEVAHKVKIPIMGVGGISSVKDALEFFYAGASVIAIGSAMFNDPELPQKIISFLRRKICYN